MLNSSTSAKHEVGFCWCGAMHGTEVMERPPFAEAVKTVGQNPKDAQGAKKVQLWLIPPASLIHEARAMEHGAYYAARMDGSKGYGPYNWRANKVLATVYISAAMRHILDYLDGEECAPDSGVHHLGHAKASLGILLDALETGNLVDDRPLPGKAAELMERFKRA